MAIRSGLAAQIGYGAESTYGTGVTPSRFLDFNSESIKRESEPIESSGLRASKRVLRTNRWALNHKGVAGEVEHEVASNGFGLLFKHALGANTVATPGGATLARTHTCVLADPYGLSLTVQVGRPDVSGTVQPFTYLGCKVAEWELSCEVDGIVTWKHTLDGRDETTGTALATASYPTADELLVWTGCTVTVGGASFDAMSFNVKGSNGLKTDRHYLNGSGLKKEPVIAEMTELSGELSGDFEGLTAYNRFVDGDTAEIVFTAEGSIIEGSTRYSVEVTLPACRFDGETPSVDGPDTLGQTLPFKVLDNGTDQPITLVYTTTDTTA